MRLSDGSYNKVRFVPFIDGIIADNLFSSPIIGPKIFWAAFVIVFYHTVCCIQNGLGRAVILLKIDNFCLWIIFFEIQNILNISTTPAVNTLVYVTYNENIVMFRCQHFGEQILYVVSILILVYQDIIKLILIFSQNFLIVVQQIHGNQQQIIEIKSIVLNQFFSIELEYFADIFFKRIYRQLLELLISLHIILGTGNNSAHKRKFEPLIVIIQLTQTFFNDYFTF